MIRDSRFALFLFVLLAGLHGSGSAQKVTTITCDSLFKMPFVTFNVNELPDGFLGCFGGHPADLLMMKKYAQVLSSEIGDGYTVGYMKHILDSVDAATQYRASADRIQACKAVYRRMLDLKRWSADSIDLADCGVSSNVLGIWSDMVRSGEFREGYLSGLNSAYEKKLPNLLEAEASQHSSACEPGRTKAFSFGLQVYADPLEAQACAAEKQLPLYFFFTGWMDNSAKRTEEIILRDLDLFQHLNRNAVLLLMYADDPTPLPPGTATPLREGDPPSTTYGEWAKEWAFRYLQIRHPSGLVILSPGAEVMKTVIGEPTREDWWGR